MVYTLYTPFFALGTDHGLGKVILEWKEGEPGFLYSMPQAIFQ